MPQSDGSSPPSRRAVAAWCFYDWANSAYPTVIVTFVFAAYFTQAVAADPVAGTSQWAWAIGVSGVAVALFSPVLGAIADRGGRRKPWIAAFTGLCVAATALLWFTRGAPEDVLWALIFVGLGNFAFEMSMVFYNAMLPDLAPASRLGRVSGWGWALGYGGGLACLALILALFDLEKPDAIRATTLFVAVWFAVFSLPLFAWTPEAAAPSAAGAVRQGLATLLGTLGRLGEQPQILAFLVARLIYNDGLVTLFAMGGIYAAGTFGFGFDELVIFGIAINVSAGLGALAFAWVDDALGPRRTILIALACLTGLSLALLVVDSKAAFWLFGVPLGAFVGPAQSASRSLMARLAPAAQRAEMFGLYALSGKSTAWAGPLAMGGVTALFESQRAGMATILVFFLIGGWLLWRVSDDKR